VQDGAYGAGIRIGQSGSLVTYSYRDPNPVHSLNIYRNMSEFVRGFAASDAELTGFIISTISETEPLVSPAQQGMIADANWFSGYGYDDAVTERKQILNATKYEL
jgi:Zn-dependent M16 (insulinase) family peptidase